VPKGLARIVERLLSKEREKRPAKATELEWDLTLFLKQEEKRQEKKKKPEGRVRRYATRAREGASGALRFIVKRRWWVSGAVAALAVLVTLSYYEPPTGTLKSVGGVDLVYIQSGSFMMGSPEGEGASEERPRHKVTVDGFWMGKYEVTQAQYEAVMGTNPSFFKGDNRRPVENISWYDAVEFCNRLSVKAGVEPYYAINKSIRDVNNRNKDDNKRWT
jgi:formylglycine-generating enzyme required for sulfatase activity